MLQKKEISAKKLPMSYFVRLFENQKSNLFEIYDNLVKFSSPFKDFKIYSDYERDSYSVRDTILLDIELNENHNQEIFTIITLSLKILSKESILSIPLYVSVYNKNEQKYRITEYRYFRYFWNPSPPTAEEREAGLAVDFESEKFVKIIVNEIFGAV